MKLNQKTSEKIDAFSDEGNQQFDKGKFKKAIQIFQKALELLPPPKKNWVAYTWLHMAIGDSLFSQKDFQNAFDSFYDAYNGPDGIENPFIVLRLGQCHFQLKDEKKAFNFLLRAYMFEGKKILKMRRILAAHVKL